MGVVYRTKLDGGSNGPKGGQFPDGGFPGANNNMAMTVLALEHIFKDSDLGEGGLSLKDGGKSRADLWALAGITAIEFTVNENNLACTSQDLPWANRYKTSGKGHHRFEESGCQVSMPSMPFSTGRKDCTPDPAASVDESYMASKEEVHPSAHGSGGDTTTFFADNFGLSPREAVVLMGAHTLGKVDARVSGFKYWWTRGENQYFNNQYYRNLVKGSDGLILTVCSTRIFFVY
jgi:hypothetical protein